MTALAMMQLVDAGQACDLGRPVRRYLPWFAIERRPSGARPSTALAHGGSARRLCRRERATSYDIVALRRDATSSRPERRGRIRTTGTALRARCSRRSTGGRGPTPCTRASSTRSACRRARRSSRRVAMATAAVGYQWRDNDRPGDAPSAAGASPPLDFVDPAGSVLSTPEDMARYMRFYLNGGKTASGTRLVSPATFAAMTTSRRAAQRQAGGIARRRAERGAGVLPRTTATGSPSSTKAATT